MRRALLILAIVLSPATSYCQAWSGIIAPSRAIDWSGAGVVGGVPSGSWTQCGSTIAAYGSAGTPASPATINNALAACAQNTYVLLGPGTFYLSAGVYAVAPTKNVAVRGSGADQTFLVFYGNDACIGYGANLCAKSSDTNYGGGPSNTATWSAGYAAASTSITLSAVTNMHVGQPIILDQLDVACTVGEGACPSTADNGSVFECSSNLIPVPCSGQNNGSGIRTARNEQQIVTVTGCGGVTTPGSACSGTNVSVTISPGIYMPDYASNRAPGAWWATNPIYGIGFENMSVDGSNDSTNSFLIVNCLGCWVSGVRSTLSNVAHVAAFNSAHITVQNSYIFRTQNAATQSYGVECVGTSDMLVVNNISQAIAAPWLMDGPCEGSVYAYNFNIFDWFGYNGYLMFGGWEHTGGTDMVLWEGNVSNGIGPDAIHGTHNFPTLFRNYLSGNLPVGGTGGCAVSGTSYATITMGNCNNALLPLQFLSYTRFGNIIGNVLGSSAQTCYEDNPSSHPCQFSVYMLGLGYTDGTSGKTIGDDSLTATTAMRWGNCDVIHGFSGANCQWNSGEVPSGLSGVNASYANSVPASHTLPASFVYSSAPSWWPVSKAWPAIGPDVTGGNQPNVGGLVYTIPAQDCYATMGGAVNGYNATPLTFNANTCYAASPVSAPAQGMLLGMLLSLLHPAPAAAMFAGR